jgi:hypothetical protein
MKAYGRKDHDGWAFCDYYSRKDNKKGRSTTKKRTDRTMKKRGRKWKSEEK